jgi:hypothetical protein
MATKKEEKKDNTQNILYIIIGVLFIAMRLLDDLSKWSTIDLLKTLFGVFLVGFGIFKIINSKKKQTE